MHQHAATRGRARLGTRVALVSLGLTALGIGATAGIGEAHSPTVSATCAGLDYSFFLYDAGDTTNLLTLAVDGTTVVEQHFGSGLAGSFAWDSTKPHTWSVTLDANVGDPGTGWDFANSGTQEACTTPTTEPTTPVTQPTTPVTQPTTPVTEPTTPVTQPTTPVTQPTTPVTEPTTPVTEPTTTPTTPATTPVTTPTTATNPTVPANGTPIVEADSGTTPAAAVPAVEDAPLAAPQDSSLPATGRNTGAELTLAMAILLAGLGLIAITRRRGRSASRNGGA